jgi:hypothetical protein
MMPYGNSNVPRDVARIVEASDDDWEDDRDEGHGQHRLREEAEDRYLRLHVEAGIALKIVLATGEFQPGHYTCVGPARGNEWERD